MDRFALNSIKRSSLALLVTVAAGLFALPLQAAQDSTVIEENAPVHAEPAANAKVIDYLPLGAEIRISSYPLPGGWYKVRARNGIYGWVHENHVSVEKETETKPRVEVIEGPQPERDRKWFIRALGGYDFFRPNDLNDAFRFNDLNTGNTIGGELGYFI
ncbi:MAG TPA: SH3 domain-containing protein, partial [Oligoflexia bacterium]|nr:SH3 domain-containing protein [Oligoflexia bacterium]